MIRAAMCVVAVSLTLAVPGFADWESVTEGVDYQRFKEKGEDIHVVRVDLKRRDLKVVATREEDKGTTVSQFAKRNKAIVAINADYFDKNMKPIGLALSPCGVWRGTKDTKREGLVAVGDRRADIYPQREVLDEPESWMTSVVSGWPVVVRNCKPLTAASLPGSDAFTRAPHPRTAVGVSSDGRTMYFVVADGRRDGVPGLTLARLGRFMHDELGVCEAINMDGGGSSAIWIDDEIVNRPSDGSERRVANHLAIVRASDVKPCELEDAKATITFKSGTADAEGRKPDVKPQP
jgi:exopolysaccharide biosynthesis protein